MNCKPGCTRLMASLLVAALGFAACDELPPDRIEVVYDPNSSHPEMDRYIGGQLNQLRVPGLAAVAVHDGAVVYEGYFGFANRETGERIDAESIFYLASVSKVVAAAAVLRALELGRFGLDEPVTAYADFDVAHPAADGVAITFRQLLTHTSGIEDNWDVLEPLVVEGDSPIQLGDFLAGYLAAGGQWYSPRRNFGAQPGTRYEYSNVGASFAAFAAGEADGSGFEELCEREVFRPLGMDSASWTLRDSDADHLTSPHVIRGGEYRPVAHYGYPDFPDGALRVTARDLARFLIAHSGPNSLLSQATLAEAFRVQFPALEDEQGLIWARLPELGQDVVGHDGGDDGISTVVALDTRTGDAALLLMNGDWYDDDRVYEMLGSLLRREIP